MLWPWSLLALVSYLHREVGGSLSDGALADFKLVSLAHPPAPRQ